MDCRVKPGNDDHDCDDRHTLPLLGPVSIFVDLDV